MSFKEQPNKASTSSECELSSAQEPLLEDNQNIPDCEGRYADETPIQDHWT